MAQITEKQREQMAVIRQWWLDRQTIPSNPDESESAVQAMWASMSGPKPRVFTVQSPLQAVNLARRIAHLKVPANPTDAWLQQRVESIGSTRIPKSEKKWNTQIYWSLWWQVWAAWYEAALEIFNVKFKDMDKYHLFRNWCLHVPFCLIFRDDLVFVTRRPISVLWENNRLHNDKGPAVEYIDGWKLWALDGVRVDEQIVMRPETQTIAQIEGEESNDLRAIRMQRYGLDRYLTETGAAVLDDMHNDIENTHEALLRTKDGQVYLWPTCPSGRICPPLRVPRETKTCNDARKWLAGPIPSKGRCLGRT